MRVKEIIERLQRDYKPDTQLLAMWWDKEQFDCLDTGETDLTVDKWDEVVQEFEWYPTLHEGQITSELSQFILDYLAQQETA